jgi:hypothetical protein
MWMLLTSLALAGTHWFGAAGLHGHGTSGAERYGGGGGMSMLFAGQVQRRLYVGPRFQVGAGGYPEADVDSQFLVEIGAMSGRGGKAHGFVAPAVGLELGSDSLNDAVLLGPTAGLSVGASMPFDSAPKGAKNKVGASFRPSVYAMATLPVLSGAPRMFSHIGMRLEFGFPITPRSAPKPTPVTRAPTASPGGGGSAPPTFDKPRRGRSPLVDGPPEDGRSPLLDGPDDDRGRLVDGGGGGATPPGRGGVKNPKHRDDGGEGDEPAKKKPRKKKKTKKKPKRRDAADPHKGRRR